MALTRFRCTWCRLAGSSVTARPAATVLIRAAHVASPSVIAALRAAGYRRAVDPRQDYDRIAWALALLEALLSRRRFVGLGLPVLMLPSWAFRLPGAAVVRTAASAAAEEWIWRGRTARTRPARALTVLGFAFLHRREGRAAVTYHLLTGFAFDRTARRYGVPVAAGLHTLHNLAADRPRLPCPRPSSMPSSVVAASPWPDETARPRVEHG